MEPVQFQKVGLKPEEKRLQDNLDRIKNKIIVLSGKGGVGKSTVSVNAARGLAEKGKKVGILDVDIHGPSIAKMLGIEGRRLSLEEGEEFPMPIKVSENLYALTIATLLENPDEPIIWRGPLKIGAIKQFLQDIKWPELDYLIIDSPPGTGDEPLTIAQTMKVNGSIIVSTPQDIALLDARKTIKFSQKMNIPVIGLIENMSTFVCPHCGGEIDIFKGMGVKKAAEDFNLEILGKIPLDPMMVESGDKGLSIFKHFNDSIAAKEYSKVADKIIAKQL